MSLNALLIDDDELTLLLNQVFIKENHFSEDIAVFSNAKEALNYLDSAPEKISSSCIILDLNMPNYNGWDFLDDIQSKEYKSHVKVVVLTSSVNNSDKDKAAQYDQVISFLEKPLNDDKIKQLKEIAPLAPYFS